MKRRLFSILTALALCLTLLPTAALAVEEAPAPAAQPSAAEATDIPQPKDVSKTEVPPQPDETVSALQAHLDALPTADSLSSADEDEIAAAYQAAQDVYDALETLDPDQLAQITGLEKLAVLMDWFNSQVMPLEADDKVTLSCKSSGSTSSNDYDTLYAALEAVRELPSGAAEITVTAGKNIKEFLVASPDYTLPTGTYTIILNPSTGNHDFYFKDSRDANEFCAITVPQNADVTIKSGLGRLVRILSDPITVKGTLKLEYTYPALGSYNTASMTIDGGTVQLDQKGQIQTDVTVKNNGNLNMTGSNSGLYHKNNSPVYNLTVESGTVTMGPISNNYAHIQHKVSLTGPQAKLVLKGGTCTESSSITCSAGQLDIQSAATIKGPITLSGSGHATISGGTFSNNAAVVLSGTASNKTIVSGGTFEGAVTLNSAEGITLSGGSFNGGLSIGSSVSGKHLSDYLAAAHAFKQNGNWVPYSTASTNTSTTGFGGSGGVAVEQCSSHANDDGNGYCDYCNAAIVASVTNNGGTVYYSDWSTALEAITSGSTLKPLAAINTPDLLTVSTSFTLDLSAQPLTVGGLKVAAGAALTVQGSHPFAVSSSQGSDGKAEINGTLNLSSGADLSAVDITVSTSGTMTVSGGTTIDSPVTSSGTMTVSGGTFRDAVNIKGGTATISGGTFQKLFKVFLEPASEPAVSVSGGVFKDGVEGTPGKLLAEGYGFRQSSSLIWYSRDSNQSRVPGELEAKPLPIKSVTLSYSPENPTVFSEVTLTADYVLDAAYSGQTPTFKWRENGNSTSVSTRQSATVTPQEKKLYEYFCTVTLGGYSKTAEVSFTAGKANIPDHYVTAPTAATGLIYNGDMQPLLSAAGAFNNTNTSLFALNYQMQYRLGADGDWTTDFSDIQASEAGTYYVYYGVKIIGQTNYNDYVCPTPLAVTIAPPPSPPVSDDADPTYSITLTDSDHGSVSLTIPRKYAWEGDTVTLNIAPDSGYALETLTVTTKSGKEVNVTVKGDKATFKMPDSAVTVSATFMEDNSMLNFFTDVFPGDYYYEPVLWAAENGITGGVTETTFAPGQPCTRAQIVTFLYRWAVALGLDVSGGEDTNILSYHDAFDIPEYAIPAFQWAVSAGILQGNDGTLTPNGGCTRAQAVTFLFRFAAAYGMDFVTMQELVSGFGDAAQVPGYALSAMNWALAHGIVNGNNGDLNPNAPCTRAQIVTFLYRMSH